MLGASSLAVTPWGSLRPDLRFKRQGERSVTVLASYGQRAFREDMPLSGRLGSPMQLMPRFRFGRSLDLFRIDMRSLRGANDENREMSAWSPIGIACSARTDWQNPLDGDLECRRRRHAAGPGRLRQMTVLRRRLRLRHTRRQLRPRGHVPAHLAREPPRCRALRGRMPLRSCQDRRQERRHESASRHRRRPVARDRSRAGLKRRKKPLPHSASPRLEE